MARPVWTGSISFGLVNVPVKLYSAKSERPVRFNQLDGRNGARIRQKRVNEVTGEEVEFGDIVKGYEISKGNYVTITDEELAALGTEATHRLDLECFVDLDEIDPIYFDGAYLVAPADAGNRHVGFPGRKPVHHGRDVMQRTGNPPDNHQGNGDGHGQRKPDHRQRRNK